MAQRSGLLVPIIIIGATLFGLGSYSAWRKTHHAPEAIVDARDNPRTMQAPPAPDVPKDAAQRAAEQTSITATLPSVSSEVTPNGSATTRLTLNPWVMSLMGERPANFRSGVVAQLARAEKDGNLNCAPALKTTLPAAIDALEEIVCTTKTGDKLEGQFDSDGDGRLEIKAPDGEEVSIRKSGTEFSVSVEAAN